MGGGSDEEPRQDTDPGDDLGRVAFPLSIVRQLRRLRKDVGLLLLLNGLGYCSTLANCIPEREDET